MFWERVIQNSGRAVLHTRWKIQATSQPTILSLQYCKLKRKSQESAQEWMGILQIKATDCKFINDLDDENITAEVIKDANSLERYKWHEQ